MSTLGSNGLKYKASAGSKLQLGMDEMDWLQYEQDEHSVVTTGMPVINREEMVRTTDGKELWVLTSKLPYRNAEGKIIGLIGIARNISLRKAFDQELYSAQAEIASLRAEVERLKAAAGNAG